MAFAGSWTVRPGFNEYTFSYMNRNWQPDQMIGKGHKKEAYSVVCLNDASDSIRETAKKIAALFMPVETDTEKSDFFREVRILHLLTGVPNISDLLHHSLDSQNGVGLFVTNKFSKCLDAWASEKDLPSKLHMLLQIARTVKKIHEAEIAHCDLKPKNIGVENDQCIIADFGSAEVDFWVDHIHKRNGTPAYSPPLKSRLTFYQKDIFALGATIYEVCQPQVRPEAFFRDITQSEISLESTLRYLNSTERNDVVRAVQHSGHSGYMQVLLLRMLQWEREEICTLDFAIRFLEDMAKPKLSPVPTLRLSKPSTSESKDGENTQRWHPEKRPPTKIPPPKCGVEKQREVVVEEVEEETVPPPYVPETARGLERVQTDEKKPQNFSHGMFRRMRIPAPLRSRTPNENELDSLIDDIKLEVGGTLIISPLETPPSAQIWEESETEERDAEKLSPRGLLRIKSPPPIRSHAR